MLPPEWRDVGRRGLAATARGHGQAEADGERGEDALCSVPEGEFDFLGYTFGRMAGQAGLGFRPVAEGS